MITDNLKNKLAKLQYTSNNRNLPLIYHLIDLNVEKQFRLLEENITFLNRLYFSINFLGDCFRVSLSKMLNP